MYSSIRFVQDWPRGTESLGDGRIRSEMAHSGISEHTQRLGLGFYSSDLGLQRVPQHMSCRQLHGEQLPERSIKLSVVIKIALSCLI